MNKGVQVDDGKGGGVLMKLRFCGWIVIGLAVGCGGDARLEMSAADALLATADQMELTIQEYHEEVSANDDSRESEVVSAFVARVLVAPDDAVAIDSHVVDFKAALAPIKDVVGALEWWCTDFCFCAETEVHAKDAADFMRDLAKEVL